MTPEELIQRCAERGIICPPTLNALKFMAALGQNALVSAVSDRDRSEFTVTVCRGGCCLNYTVIPNEVTEEADMIRQAYILSEMLQGRLGDDVVREGNAIAIQYTEDRSFAIHELTGMN